MDILVRHGMADRPFFAPGDSVKGEVVLRDTNASKGVEATITFIGTAKTHMRAKGGLTQPSHSSEISLFDFRQLLGVGRRAPRSPDQIWPFEFTFPTGVKAAPQKQRYSNDANFQRMPGHALPPSFGEFSRPDNSDSNAITYTLEATITKPYPSHPFPPGTMKADKHLTFSPVREAEHYQPIPTPILTPLSIKGHHLTAAEDRSHEHTLRGRSEHSSTSHHQHHLSLHHPPHLHLSLRTETPEVTPAGVPLPFYLGVDYPTSTSKSASKSASPLPPTHLHSLVISLESITRARTPMAYLGLGPEPQETSVAFTQLADSGAVDVVLVDGERLDAQELIMLQKGGAGLAIAAETVPSFKTWNLAREYVLHVEIRAEVGGEGVSVKVERGVVVLPAGTRGPVVEEEEGHVRVGLSGGVGVERTEVVDESAPPPYEEREGEGGSSGIGGRRLGGQRLPEL